MADMENTPQIYLFKQDKRTCIGTVSCPVEFTEDVRFNACSEISFTVADKYYDIDQEKWVNNPYYDNIERHRLVYLTDNRDYFKYPVRAIGDENYYKYKSNNALVNRPDRALTFNQNNNIVDLNFQVQAETELFDIGTGMGYSFRHFAYILSNGSEGSGIPGDIQDMSYLHWSSAAATYNPRLALETYVPVEPTDVIAIQTGGSTSIPSFLWRVAAYERQDADSYVGYWNLTSYGSSRINVASKLPNGGFVRFWYANTPNTSGCYYSYDSSTGAGSCGWVYPVAGYAKIYSGERRCTFVRNSSTNGYTTSKMRWFQIQSVDEQADGICRTKKVTALSYEYSLHSSTFSLSSATLPLYIPEAITGLVNGTRNDGAVWIRDKKDTSSTPLRSVQRMERGVLNQILDYLPNWKIKYVSSKLMTSYRTLEDVDDVNIYSYLMDTLQSVYNCFIVFDNDDMTISAYTLSDINNMKTPVCLTWDNSIQHFEKNNIDASYFTALRVKAGDSVYGVGLVNPTGNAMIYNFDRILNELNYTIPNVQGEYKRTLKEAVTLWKKEYNNQLKSTSSYQTTGKRLITLNMDVIKYESEMRTALANYRAKADVINTFLRDDRDKGLLGDVSFALIQIPDTPWTVQRIKSGMVYSGNNADSSKQFHNASLQNELASLADAYWKAKDSYDSACADFDSATATLKGIAKKLTMSYAQAYKANGNNEYAFSNSTTLLSAAEIKELSRYIVEGVWNYENASFSETYNGDDIYNTLSEILSEANFDLVNRLAIANFDFSVDTANILAIPGFKTACKGLYFGHQFGLNVSHTEYISPMLLEMHRNYKDENDFSFAFTTDMKRKPIQFRFADLYSTITQTSVTDSTFTFDE